MHNNVFRVKSGGSNLFRNPRQKEVRSVHFHHNEVILETGAVSNPNNWRFGFLCQSRNGISDVTVKDNTFRFLDPASDNMVVRVGSGTVAEPADGIHIKNNIAFGAVTGVKIRGADYVDRVYVSGNTFVDFLGGSSCGVEVAGNSKHPPKLVSVTANRFIDDRESAEFANGVHASGKIEALEVDGNAYDGVTGEHVVLQNVSLDRYLGDELRVLAQPPTAGVWETGERVCNASPAAGDFLGWVCVAAGSPGTWRGFGRIEA